MTIALFLAITSWPKALGVEYTKPGKAMVKERMLPIFEEIPKHFDKAQRMPQTQCYMCHQGRVKPERTP
jgi:hypothetical protein